VRVNDAISGVVLVLFALAMIAYTRTFPAMPGQNYGSALFPVMIGVGMIICGVILIVGGLARRRTEPMFGGTEWLRSPRHVAGFLAMVGGLLFYILVSDWLGFIPTALLLLFGWIVLLRGGRPASALALALAVVLVVDYVFKSLLLVPLPLGLLQPILY
jgi:putative tricarboxylic transport membrane protein